MHNCNSSNNIGQTWIISFKVSAYQTHNKCVTNNKTCAKHKACHQQVNSHLKTIKESIHQTIRCIWLSESSSESSPAISCMERLFRIKPQNTWIHLSTMQCKETDIRLDAMHEVPLIIFNSITFGMVDQCFNPVGPHNWSTTINAIAKHFTIWTLGPWPSSMQ